MSDGIILIDKPSGITSFDVIRKLRRVIGVRKIGHAGTLDPLATGLLIIGVGTATKELTALVGLPKAYEAEILLGSRTDTSDVDGKVLETSPVPIFSQIDIEKVIGGMKGEIDLPVSLYSAIKKDGKPLYKYAREGESVEAPIRKMIVRDARFVSYENNIVRTVFDVSSGTYVRSLAEELARRLGTIGTIQNLRRISIGDYDVKDAKKLEDF
ncbi:MAG: tRNA pseudouridine(55) synthase TruB [Candidatus Taylorbacteria bacterium CG10_big_fil_rev_8_21_14_0_10_41_48]|uniref:tRNA pseudouridine synthase B n=1 Tax=Candidatus Taylorbacteria bacterium CG10_big_fil_rev_8_21_14_0_10_41_48 TaxID=1975024 RepID=A0A2M8LBS3_9BACT|nr:MAG: tRNA pseudouridine(55) synthase TruB [Candidatus Taylorbacteria bacterium CG10_big_fil_rev_8_21_14_0_10_41_48]